MSKYPYGPRLRVTCTKEDITKAVANDSTRCWIAEAIKRTVPEADHVAVDLFTVRFTNPERGQRYVYLTPYAAQLALIAFDEGRPPEPFVFVLKNAHVTRGGPKPKKDAAEGDTDAEVKTKGAQVKTKGARRDFTPIPAQAVIAAGTGSGSAVPRRVGGRRPPQLRMMRKFGIRAFRGASQQRLEADAALTQRLETSE